MKFQTQYNRDEFPDRGYEKNDEVSMTVPNQSLTVRELVYRFTHGMDLSLGLSRSYSSEDDLDFPPDWNKLDLSEKMNWIGRKQQEVQDSADKLKAAKNAEEQKRRDAEIDRRVQEKFEAHKAAIEQKNILKKPEGAPGGE